MGKPVRAKKRYDELYQCSKCKEVHTVQRTRRVLKEIGHTKHMYCGGCKRTTLHYNRGLATIGRLNKYINNLAWYMSVYNKDLNCIFVHIPKTGGTSIADILGGTGHKNIAYFLTFFRSHTKFIDISDTFKFAFVRDPYERSISATAQLGYVSSKSMI